jgi:hypothetical protein
MSLVATRESASPAQFRQAAVGRVKFGDVVRLQFDVEAAGEALLIPADGRARLVFLPVVDQLRISPWRSREHDQAVAVAFQHVFVNAWLVVEAFQLGDARQLEQILMAGLVLRQHESGDRACRRLGRDSGATGGQGRLPCR